MTILNSATKIVLLAMTAALIGLSFMQLEIPELFDSVMIAVVAFYFGQKNECSSYPRQRRGWGSDTGTQ